MKKVFGRDMPMQPRSVLHSIDRDAPWTEHPRHFLASLAGLRCPRALYFRSLIANDERLALDPAVGTVLDEAKLPSRSRPLDTCARGLTIRGWVDGRIHRKNELILRAFAIADDDWVRVQEKPLVQHFAEVNLLALGHHRNWRTDAWAVWYVNKKTHELKKLAGPIEMSHAKLCLDRLQLVARHRALVIPPACAAETSFTSNEVCSCNFGRMAA